MEKIVLFSTDGSHANSLPLDIYEKTKEAIVEVFLGLPIATYAEIEQKVKLNLTGKIEGDISEYVKLVVPDLEVRSFIEKIPGSNPVQYQLKLFHC